MYYICLTISLFRVIRLVFSNEDRRKKTNKKLIQHWKRRVGVTLRHFNTAIRIIILRVENIFSETFL